MSKITLIQGNCLEKMKELQENSVDSIVTDPPYGLEFMGKEWDAPWKGKASPEFNTSCEGKLGGFKSLPNHSRVNNVQCKICNKWKFSGSPCVCDNPDFPNARLMAMQQFQDWNLLWAKECLRVLKPGGHLLAFSGTRTYHRMASAIEDAGFEVRDMIEWVYGSGFPKSLNIGKAVDKLKGNEREVVGIKNHANKDFTDNLYAQDPANRNNNKIFGYGEEVVTKGASEWEGWGTALKPAHEPICMARKPLAEKTVAENCLKYGTGGINIDESRVGTTGGETHKGGFQKQYVGEKVDYDNHGVETDLTPKGRFPANLIHDNSEEVRECFPETAPSKAGVRRNKQRNDINIYGGGSGIPQCDLEGGFNDSGNASRFFKSIIYQAKASKSDRNKGCDEPNRHPTIKPIALMEYLIKMVTPKGGTVLDPFMGSGSTGVACKKNGYDFIGIEMEAEYIKIAESRISNHIIQSDFYV